MDRNDERIAHEARVRTAATLDTIVGRALGCLVILVLTPLVLVLVLVLIGVGIESRAVRFLAFVAALTALAIYLARR